MLFVQQPEKKIDGSVTIEIEERLVANSEGLWKREVGTRMNAEIMTMIKIDDFLGIGSSRVNSRELQEDWQNLFNSSIQTAYNQQGKSILYVSKKFLVRVSVGSGTTPRAMLLKSLRPWLDASAII